MAKKPPRVQLILFVLFVLPLSVYMIVKSISRPQFERVPFAYTITENGDSLVHELPPFSFTDQEGRTLTREDLLGTIYIISFIDPQDTLITRILNSNLDRLYKNVMEGANIRFMSVHTDTSSLAGYEKAQEVDAQKWAFVHGTREAVLRLGRDAFRLEAFEGKDTTNLQPFTAKDIALVDKAGRVRKYYAGTDLGNVRTITDDLRSLIVMEYPEELRD